MLPDFNFQSTADDVLAGVDLTGKRVLVTGATSGIGVETVRSLAAHGAEVVGTARNLEKGENAFADIGLSDAQRRSISLVELDLASLQSVRSLADALNAEGSLFDLIVANAGVMATPLERTVDGFEMQLAVNHLGHFVLINRIAKLLAPGGRVVVVSSHGHRDAPFAADDLNFEREDYNPWLAYARAKTASSLFAVEFDRRYRELGIRAVAVHPGGILTDLPRHIGGASSIEAVVTEANKALTAAGKPAFAWKTLGQGAATTVWAGVVAPADLVGGTYCEDCGVSPTVEGEVGLTTPGVRPYAIDPALAQRVWASSEELVQEQFSLPKAAAN